MAQCPRSPATAGTEGDGEGSMSLPKGRTASNLDALEAFAGSASIEEAAEDRNARRSFPRDGRIAVCNVGEGRAAPGRSPAANVPPASCGGGRRIARPERDIDRDGG